MSANQRSRNLKFGLLAVFIILAIPGQAQAYIGPGAGFAVGPLQKLARRKSEERVWHFLGILVCLY